MRRRRPGAGGFRPLHLSRVWNQLWRASPQSQAMARGFDSSDSSHSLNACNSAQEEKACCGLSPEAGLPMTRIAQALTGSGELQMT